jgi:HEAT repeat protein
MNTEMFCPKCLETFLIPTKKGEKFPLCTSCKVTLKVNEAPPESKPAATKPSAKTATRTNLKNVTPSPTSDSKKKNTIALAAGAVAGLLVLGGINLILYQFKKEAPAEIVAVETSEQIPESNAIQLAALQKTPADVLTTEILELLNSDNKEHHLAALKAILAKNSDALLFLDDCLKLAKSSNEDLNKVAINCLGLMKPEGNKILPELFALFKGASPEIQALISNSMINLGPYDLKEAEPYLNNLKPESASELKLAALILAGQINGDVSAFQNPIIESLKVKDPEITKAAINALGKIALKNPKNVVPLLLPFLDSKDATISAIANKSLAGVAFVSAPDLEVLVDFLGEKNSPQVQAKALEFLTKQGKFNWASFAEKLKPTLTSKDDSVHELALVAALQAGSNAKVLVQELKILFKEPHENIKIACLKIFEKVGREGNAIGEIVEACSEPNLKVRELAFSMLSNLKPPLGAMDALVIKEKIIFASPDIKLFLLEALATCGKETTVASKEIAILLKDKDNKIKEGALKTICNMGPDSKDLLPDVVAFLKIDSPSTEDLALAKVALSTLEKLGPNALPALDEISKQIENKNLVIAKGSLTVLGAMGKEALPALTKMIAAFINRDLLEFASDQISKIGIDAVKPLIKGLESPTPEVRLGSALSLGNMGSIAKEAAPALAKLAFQDKVPLVRSEAKKAQLRVQSGTK